jgi:hypothetical protein
LDFGRIKGGEWVMSSWIKFVWSSNSSQTFDSSAIKESFRNLGIQGSSPIDATRKSAFSDEMLGILGRVSKKTSAPSANLQDYYCVQVQRCRVIIRDIANRHSKFFTWLNCKLD